MNSQQAISAGIELQKAERFAEAEHLYRELLKRDPHNPSALHLLGLLAHQQGRHQEALIWINQSLAIDASVPDFHNNLGNILGALGLHEDALAAFRRALDLKPDFVLARNNCGVALHKLGRSDEGLLELQTAIALQPNYADSYNNLGIALRQVGRFDEATKQFEKAVRLNPGSGGAWDNLANVQLQQGEIVAAINSFRRAVELLPTDPTVHSNLLYALQYDPNSTREALLAEHVAWAAAHADPLAAYIVEHQHDSDPTRILRVGYVSPDFCQHSVATFFQPLLEAHDRSHFHITCYSSSDRTDGVSLRLRSLSDRWGNIARLDDEAAARQIRHDKIDILARSRSSQ